MFGLSGVVHEQREVECRRIVVLLEQLAIAGEFRIVAGEQLVEFVDADQCVFVRRVAVEKFVLHEAGEASELREVAPEKIRLVHEAQNASDLALARKDGEEDFARGP